jgi:BlaI family penicillinase repressor
MNKKNGLSQGEWKIMELLWQEPHTLMQLVAKLEGTAGWSKSTVATMVRRMEASKLIRYTEQGRAKLFSPAISREEAAIQETDSLLQRAYRGSLGLLVSTMVQRNSLSKSDIDELYAILKKAEEDAQ